MTTDPKTAVEKAARELLRVLAELPEPPTLHVTGADGGVACFIQVWDANKPMPTAGVNRPHRMKGGRELCRADILEVVTAAGCAMTRKEVIRALKLAEKGHGPGTVAKALADLTASGELVNPRDSNGYRLAEWPRDRTPSLFD